MKPDAIQLPLLPGCEPPRQHKQVRTTSKLAYNIGRETFKGRKATVLRCLAAFWNRWQTSPTSAELAKWADPTPAQSWDFALLLTRRGLSDLKAVGIVEPVPNGERECGVTHHRCETWRVVERGVSPNR
jgi:hypothetical protein